MDVLYRYEGLEFVWDVQKAATNLAKHGIRFEQACEVFLDPLAQILDAAVSDEARDALAACPTVTPPLRRPQSASRKRSASSQPGPPP